MPASNQIVAAQPSGLTSGNLTEAYQRLIDNMVKKINDLEARLVKLGG